MGNVRLYDTASQTVVELNGTGDNNSIIALDDAIRKAKMVPLRDDGSAMRVQEFMGGLLVDGMPLGVVFGGPWLAGQREVLAPLIQAGKVPAPPNDVWNRGQVPMPQNVLQATADYVKAHPESANPTEAGAGSGIPTWVLLAGGAVLLYMFMGGSGRGHSSQGELF